MHDEPHWSGYHQNQVAPVPAPVNFQFSKFQDPEWAKMKADLQGLDLKEDMDPTFRMQKQRYEYTKAFAEMMYEADPKWQQAKY